MDMTVPAVYGCKLDRVTMVFASATRSLWLLSEPANTTALVGDYKSRQTAVDITPEVIAERPALAEYEGLTYIEWTGLSTNAGASGVVTQENTPYYLQTYNNPKVYYIEYEYIPVE